MIRLSLVLLSVYKNLISKVLLVLFGNACRFTPTCSEYAKESIQKFGITKGGSLAIKRLARCHPLSQGGYDPVPVGTEP